MTIKIMQFVAIWGLLNCLLGVTWIWICGEEKPSVKGKARKVNIYQ